MASAQDQIGLIMQLRRRGIRDNAVLRAIERVPRELFVDEAFADHAYQDIALPIDCGQTISQPYVVAFMTEKLELDDRHKVLEIGTGSGYQAAVLSHLCRRVYTVERWRELQKAADRRLRQARHHQCHHHHRRRLARLAAAGAVRPHHRHRGRDRGAAGADRAAQGRRPHDHPVGRDARHADAGRHRQDRSGAGQTELLPVRFVPLVHGRAGVGARQPKAAKR